MNFVIEINPVLESAVRDLKSATDEEIDKFFKDLSVVGPREMQDLLGYGDRSKPGEPPTNDTFELYRSIIGEAEGKSATISFAEYAKHLDPVFGGKLNRPFIVPGLENAVRKLQPI